MCEILSAQQAAKVIGCAPQLVRERMKRGIWNFGTVVTAKQAGAAQNSYEINKYKFAAWLGIPVEELERRLNSEERNTLAG